MVSECIPLLNARVRGTVGEAQSRLSAISQLPVWSAFFDFDFCGCPHGIFGSCPFERLHAWQSGLMKNAMEKLFLLSDLPAIFMEWYDSEDASAISRPRVNITDSQLYINKAKFEAIFRYLTMYSRRQSDREVPRTPFRNGVTDLTRLNGQEYPGLVMLTIVALKALLHEKVPSDRHDDIIRLFWWMLVLNEMMNEKESTASTLLLLDQRIEEFLILYKKVFGPTSAAVSSTALRKVKFHAPKHAVFYMKRYGSSDNFFGGNLESALKSTVKAPTKQTSRRHDRLSKELACRQQDRFVCKESRRQNASSIDDFRTQALIARNSRKKRFRPMDQDCFSEATEKPTGWELHKPVFYLTRKGEDNWSTHIGSFTHYDLVVYPDFVSDRNTDLFDDGEDQYVIKLAQYSRKEGFQRIDCSCGAFIPSSRGDERDVLRCHPSFHSYPYLKRPWHDWAMVKWLHSHDNGEEEVYVAARILLFGRLSDNENDSIPPKIVAVIHSLIDFHTPQDSLLFFAKGDSLDEGGPDIVDATAIEETAFVLPCVKDQGDDFPTSHDTANYFIVFPPRSEWKNIWYGGESDNVSIHM